MVERRIVGYTLLTAGTVEQLTALVRSAIGEDKNGYWEPLGGIAVSLAHPNVDQYPVFAQAIACYRSVAVLGSYDFGGNR